MTCLYALICSPHVRFHMLVCTDNKEVTFSFFSHIVVMLLSNFVDAIFFLDFGLHLLVKS